jgi:RNA polymerase sigma-70 factor (ECF subfamily)
VNAATDQARRRGRARLATLDPEDAGVVADPGPDLGEAVTVAVAVQTALTKVPEEFRVAVVLCDLYRVPYADAAQIMEVPVGTVKSRVFRGRAALATCLATSDDPDPPLGVATPPGTDPGPATSEPTGPDHPRNPRKE